MGGAAGPGDGPWCCRLAAPPGRGRAQAFRATRIGPTPCGHFQHIDQNTEGIDIILHLPNNIETGA